MRRLLGLFFATLACSARPGLEPAPKAPTPPTSSQRSGAPEAGPSASRRPLPPPGSLPEALSPEAGPLSFEAAGADGSFIVYCQARADTDGDGELRVEVGPDGRLSGDRLMRHLSLASGEDLAIDAFLGASADERYLALQQDQKLLLLDTATGKSAVLSGADLGREPGLALPQRALAFDQDSVFFLRKTGGGTDLVERGLETGAERVAYASPTPIVSFDVDGAGSLIVVEVPGEDRDGNGRFDWPFSPLTDPPPCQGPVPRFQAERVSRDRPGVVVLDRHGDKPRRVGDLALVLGNDLVRRRADGALLLERQGQSSVLADTRCEGHVLWGDSTKNLFLLGCKSPDKIARFDVVLWVEGRTANLGLDVAALDLDEPVTRSRRLVALYPGAETVLFDTERRRVRTLSPGDQVLSTWNQKAFIRRGRKAVVFDADAVAERPLSISLDPLGEVLIQDRLVYAGPFVIDLETERVLGSVPGRALALSRRGTLLLPRVAASASHLAEGPLSWHVPE